MSYSASSEFTDLVSAKLALIEDELGRQAGADTPFVTEAANHIISAGGKRFRPLLVVLCSQFGDAVNDADLVRAAVVMELTHVASLYHDDVMDEASRRRGAPSSNLRWGNSVAIMVGEDDGISPVLRLDSVGKHTVGAGSAQQAIFDKLVTDPLERLELSFQDIDKYATELHNPELTEPSGSGNVPNLNYRLIAALAVRKKEIDRERMGDFVEAHGMPGFSPTQGHIASAVPFLGHALDRMMDGRMERAMFLAKGSLFLGRMTQMSDGMSFILEANNKGGK